MGDNLNTKNCGTELITTAFSKKYEKTLYKQKTLLRNQNILLNILQFGFR